MKHALITGSCGLVGSACTRYFLGNGWRVMGLDNNSRFAYFGQDGDVATTRSELRALPNYHHLDLDLRERMRLQETLRKLDFDLVVHAAAQPSHDLAARIPFADFEVNAYGTLILLEMTRQYWKEAPFVYFSTNKVYGDGPNDLAYHVVDGIRYDLNAPNEAGIREDFPVDGSTHSLFGCSKLAADVYVQEYGRYFGLATCCLRAGCLSGEGHAGAQLHGFLAYLVRCARERRVYSVFGYGGLQVRDNLHADDVAAFVGAFADAPRSAEVYNLGGGRANSCSILEAMRETEMLGTGERFIYRYVDEVRLGDHRVYYSDLAKVKHHYPRWSVTVPWREIIRRIWECRSSS